MLPQTSLAGGEGAGCPQPPKHNPTLCLSGLTVLILYISQPGLRQNNALDRFGRFDRLPACDRQTHGLTHGQCTNCVARVKTTPAVARLPI